MTGASQSLGEAFSGTGYPRLALDLLEILLVTALLILRDLTTKNRPFDWVPIILTVPFAWLLLIQSAIASGALCALVALQRARLGGTDAWWVALAGLSILKALPGGGAQNQNGTQLANLLEWLLQKLYGQLALQIRKNSRAFANDLMTTYSKSPDDFLRDTVDFIDATESATDAATDGQSVTTTFKGLANDAAKVEYLANWIAPRATRKQWRRLTGK
jgi:hypothetical protein